ncbi:uncharacterized protein LOC123970384 isoform X2 [Micropterus dolomieu]|uniref:uncharacterized protein LOC123970384 isoform X2 n=1 Tax=Micropterus dolomieu TaxID=147949 RepID=UPI001E8D0DF3|nr:uncharacterized protein LOC123970384 isoform X2 [Micropterus dolomieu]
MENKFSSDRVAAASHCEKPVEHSAKPLREAGSTTINAQDRSFIISPYLRDVTGNNNFSITLDCHCAAPSQCVSSVVASETDALGKAYDRNPELLVTNSNTRTALTHKGQNLDVQRLADQLINTQSLLRQALVSLICEYVGYQDLPRLHSFARQFALLEQPTSAEILRDDSPQCGSKLNNKSFPSARPTADVLPPTSASSHSLQQLFERVDSFDARLQALEADLRVRSDLI